MELPHRYGNYVLHEKIAVGGMGEVFRASFAGLAGFERSCAVKRILPHLSDDREFIERLIAEAKIAVQLSHRNIVQVYELGRVGEQYFIALEWIDGLDLATIHARSKAKSEPLPLALELFAVLEVARAVDYAHRQGIVHRDISPQNVLVSVDGGVKLGDFGIAVAAGIARSIATGTGAVLGKRRYMSPEQRKGRTVDARTDVYALGALLYEAVAGFAPDPDVAVEPLSRVVGQVPEALTLLARDALAVSPEERLPSASVFSARLDECCQRLALGPDAVRDPAPELGRRVRRLAAETPTAPERSISARLRDAMRPGVSTGTGEVTEATGTASVSVSLPDPAEAVTIVGRGERPSATRTTAGSENPFRRRLGHLPIGLALAAAGIAVAIGTVRDRPPHSGAPLSATPSATIAAGARPARPSGTPRSGGERTAAVRKRGIPAIVTLRADDGATVYVDGKKIGRAPVGRRKLHAGEHRFAVVHPRHGRRERSVTLTPGERATVDLRTKP